MFPSESYIKLVTYKYQGEIGAACLDGWSRGMIVVLFTEKGDSQWREHFEGDDEFCFKC